MTVETTGTRTSRHRRPAGFSLAELMFALAILGIALTALAPLFPAAVKENQSSANNVVGTLICKNVLAVAKTRLSHKGMGTLGTDLTQIEPARGRIGEGDLKYPLNNSGPSDTRGALLFARRTAARRSLNDYLLVVVSYAKLKPTNNVEARRLTGRSIDASKKAFPGAGRLLKIRSPVIALNGRFAFIKSVSGDVVTLDRDVPVEAVSDAFVIVETDAAGNLLDEIVSPVMSILVTRTALRE